MAAALVLVAVPVVVSVEQGHSTREQPAIDGDRCRALIRHAVSSQVKPSYTVKAVLLRSRNDVETPITAGTPLAAGDQLAMRIEASTEVHVYVLNADDTARPSVCIRSKMG